MNFHQLSYLNFLVLIYFLGSILTLIISKANGVKFLDTWIKSLIFLLALDVGFNSKSSEKSTFKALYIIILVFDVLDFLQISHLIKDVFFARSTEVIGTRGASGIFTEPSYNAIAVLCLMLLSSNYFKTNLWKIYIPGILSILTFSTMAIFPLLLVFKRMNHKMKFITLISVTFLFYHFASDVRILSIVSILLDNPELLLNDDSINSRLGYILRDVQVFFSNYGLPILPGYYSIEILNFPATTIYNPFLPGSLSGYWLVQLGIIYLLIIIWFVFKAKKGRLERLLLALMSFQMISLAFVLVPFTIGKLLNGKRDTL